MWKCPNDHFETFLSILQDQSQVVGSYSQKLILFEKPVTLYKNYKKQEFCTIFVYKVLNFK